MKLLRKEYYTFVLQLLKKMKYHLLKINQKMKKKFIDIKISLVKILKKLLFSEIVIVVKKQILKMYFLWFIQILFS